MKKILAWAFLFCITIGFAAAQEEGQEGRREKIESQKVSFLTTKLNLSPEEAKAFWPVYNKYQEETHNLRKSKHADRINARKNFDTMSDKDLEKLVDGEIISRQAELDILKKYHAQFKQVLPIKKVALFYKAEQDFKRELLKQIKGRH